MRHTPFLLLPLLAGCISIAPEEDPTPAPDEETELVTFTSDGDVTTAVVDATGETDWVHIDLDNDLATTEGWDIALRRSDISVNGGVTGEGGVEVQLLDAEFDDVEQAVNGGWLTDVAGDEGTTYAFVGEQPWYDYDFETHVLTPHPGTWVVHTTDDLYYKVAFEGYYDDAGTSAVITMRWDRVGAPPSLGAGIEIDASGEDWVYLTLDGDTVAVSDASTDLTWDLAVTRTQWKTNSGVSGSGLGGAAEAPAPLEDLTAADTVGFAADAMLPLPGPPGSGEFAGSELLNLWYDYNLDTHEVSARGDTVLVRGAAGDLGAIRVTGWDDGRYSVEFARLDRVPAIHELEIDASDSEAWVYVSLRAGEIVEVTEPSTDLTWDIALQRTKVQTNSGTSGPGVGGAILHDLEALADIASVATEGYTADAMLPIPGPPGSGEYSGNEVFGGWYDYDGQTHVVSAGDRSYALVDAAGGAAKVRVTGWDDGVYTLQWAHAGPADFDFPVGAR